jgi:hypothetical protein
MKIYWRCELGCGGSGEVELGDRIIIWDAISRLSDAHRAVSNKCEEHNGPFELNAELEDGEKMGINAAAREMGARGGAKGGKARADNLSAERLREIARMGAAKRWGKKT